MAIRPSFSLPERFRPFVCFCREWTVRKSQERGWDIVILVLVHLPALNGHFWGLRGDLVRALNDQLDVVTH